jgi:hypothetical protein
MSKLIKNESMTCQLKMMNCFGACGYKYDCENSGCSWYLPIDEIKMIMERLAERVGQEKQINRISSTFHPHNDSYRSSISSRKTDKSYIGKKELI